jgi:hypothetical protein
LPIKALLLIFALGRMSRARRPVLPQAIDRIDAANSVVAEHIARRGSRSRRPRAR